MKVFLTVLLVLIAVNVEAGVTKLKFWNYSTGSPTVCSVIGGEAVRTPIFIPKPSTARNVLIPTKPGGGIFSNYSATLSSSQVHISCYNALTLVPSGALYVIDDYNSIFFPVTEARQPNYLPAVGRKARLRSQGRNKYSCGMATKIGSVRCAVSTVHHLKSAEEGHAKNS